MLIGWQGSRRRGRLSWPGSLCDGVVAPSLKRLCLAVRLRPRGRDVLLDGTLGVENALSVVVECVEIEILFKTIRASNGLLEAACKFGGYGAFLYPLNREGLWWLILEVVGRHARCEVVR